MKNTYSLLFASLVLSACGGGGSSNSTETETQTQTQTATETVAPKYAFAFKESGDLETEYLILQEDIMQNTLSAENNGHEQQGWNFFYAVGNTVFVSGYDNFETSAYQLNDEGQLAKMNSFVFDSPLEMFGTADKNTLLASDQPRDGTHTTRTLYTVDATTGLVSSKTAYHIFDEDTGTVGEGTVGWASGLVVRNGELFVPFHKLDDQGYYLTPDSDKAYVAIYDYPLSEGASPKTIISDDRTSHIGVNGSITSLIKTESGDMYSFSSGKLGAGFSPASNKPSGLLKIASGAVEFDANYFFNIEEATNGGSIFWFDYLGNNKAIARIVVDNTDEAAWSFFGKDNVNQKLVIIDLAAETITDVAGVPIHHKRWSTPVEVIDGKVNVSIETADGAFVYEVDIASATAIQGAEIKGKTVKGFFDLAN